MERAPSPAEYHLKSEPDEPRLSDGQTCSRLSDVILREEFAETMKRNATYESDEVSESSVPSRPKRQRRQAEEIDRTWECPIEGCSLVYTSKWSLRNHMKAKHPDNLPRATLPSDTIVNPPVLPIVLGGQPYKTGGVRLLEGEIGMALTCVKVDKWAVRCLPETKQLSGIVSTKERVLMWEILATDGPRRIVISFDSVLEADLSIPLDRDTSTTRCLQLVTRHHFCCQLHMKTSRTGRWVLVPDFTCLEAKQGPVVHRVHVEEAELARVLPVLSPLHPCFFGLKLPLPSSGPYSMPSRDPVDDPCACTMTCLPGVCSCRKRSPSGGKCTEACLCIDCNGVNQPAEAINALFEAMVSSASSKPENPPPAVLLSTRTTFAFGTTDNNTAACRTQDGPNFAKSLQISSKIAGRNTVRPLPEIPKLHGSMTSAQFTTRIQLQYPNSKTPISFVQSISLRSSFTPDQ